MTRKCDAGGEIGWFPCQYVERRGAAAARNSLGNSSGVSSHMVNAAGAAVAISSIDEDVQVVDRPASERDLPLHARLSLVSMLSVTSAEEITGDDIESDVAELVSALQKRHSPMAASVSGVPSPPSSDSRGSIDRVLLLSVVGPGCSVTQTALAPSPVPAATGDAASAGASDENAGDSSVAQTEASAVSQDVPVANSSGSAAETGHSAAPAPRNALEFKWMLWTGRAYEPFSNTAHDLIEKSMRAFEMRVVIDLSTGQRNDFDPEHGLKLFVNPVGRTAYFYNESTRKKVRRSLQLCIILHSTKPAPPGRCCSYSALQLVHRQRGYVAASSRAQRYVLNALPQSRICCLKLTRMYFLPPADDLEFAFQKSRLAASSGAPAPQFLVPINDRLVANVSFSTQCALFDVLVAATGQKMCDSSFLSPCSLLFVPSCLSQFVSSTSSPDLLSATTFRGALHRHATPSMATRLCLSVDPAMLFEMFPCRVAMSCACMRHEA